MKVCANLPPPGRDIRLDLFRGLNRYLRVNAHKAVDAHDLSNAIADATGRNVEPFFDQWIYKPGHPALEASWRYDAAEKAVKAAGSRSRARKEASK